MSLLWDHQGKTQPFEQQKIHTEEIVSLVVQALDLLRHLLPDLSQLLLGQIPEGLSGNQQVCVESYDLNQVMEETHDMALYQWHQVLIVLEHVPTPSVMRHYSMKS